MSHIHMVKGPKAHTHSVWLYWGVFFALVFFTILTVYSAQFDFGKWNTIVMLTIASSKSLLVFAVFMHLAFDNKFFALVLGTSIIFLSLFIVFSVLDFATRSEVDRQVENFLPRDEKVFKHAKDDPKALPLRPGLQDAQPDKLIYEEPGH